jgi:pyridoxal phosphate enzyme (YggS family)
MTTSAYPHIFSNLQKILSELSPGVDLVVAAKKRSLEEVIAAISAGAGIIGENYIQETEKVFSSIGRRVRWHFIGHLQRNKVRRAIQIFDLIETLDSIELAYIINREAKNQGKKIPVLLEINSGEEAQKSGFLPSNIKTVIRELASFKFLNICGLMTMGPLTLDAEQARPYFVLTRKLAEDIKSLEIEGINMNYLSMGMSDTYRVAIEEGANIIRIGSAIFGPRN